MTTHDRDHAITALTRARNACFYTCAFALALLTALNLVAL